MENINELIVGFCGGTISATIILIFLNIIINKTIEKGIDTVFEKNLEKYRNKIQRSTSAFEIILNKELDFYANIDSIISEMIVLIQDLSDVTLNTHNYDNNTRHSKLKEYFMIYLDTIPKLKHLLLLNQSYIPMSISDSATKIVTELQNNMTYFGDIISSLAENQEPTNDINEANNIKDTVLMQIAVLNSEIQKRLKELCDT